MIKIGYFADGPWSHNAFEMLIADKDIKIEFICVRFDTKDEKLQNYAKQYAIPYLKHQNVNEKLFIDLIKGFDCDLFVSMSFNQIFRKEIINLPRLKTINCHAGKLPFYRGRNILNWALINDEKEFGITVHYVDEGIDTGDIILQRVYPISENDDYATLLERSYIECANILYESIRLFVDDKVNRVKQSDKHSVGFYCSQRKQGDEVLDWNQTSREVFNFIRAICCPGPQARTLLNGRELSINKAQFISDAPSYKGIAGAILNKDATGFYVKTKDSFIKVVDYTYDGVIRVGDRFDVK